MSRFNFAGQPVEIRSGYNGKTINVRRLLRNLSEFHGDFNVHYLINFDLIFSPLIGRYNGRFGPWNPDRLIKQGIIILEYHPLSLLITLTGPDSKIKSAALGPKSFPVKT